MHPLVTRAYQKGISLKKITLFILCLLCTITASALSYASPYKGAGRGGYIYTTSAVHQRAASAGMAQAPVASMASTSSSMGRGIASAATPAASTPSVQGIQTSASQVYGGVTTYDSGQRNVPGRRNSEVVPGKPGECHCEDLDNDGYCDHCWAEYDEFDGGCSNDPCWCPLDFNWAVALFMAILATAYGVYKKRTSTLQ